MNPLYMGQILRLTFGYLDEKELYNVRQVCTDWNSVGKVEIQSRYNSIILKSKEDTQKYILLFSSPEFISSSGSSLPPHFKFNLQYVLEHDCPIYSTFFVKMGRYIRSLRMLSSNFISSYASTLTIACPNLEEVLLDFANPLPAHINNNSTSNCSIWDEVDLSKLIRSQLNSTGISNEGADRFKKLTLLSIGSDKIIPTDEEVQHIVKMLSFLSTPGLGYLQTIEIFVHLPNIWWNFLTKCKFRLKSITAGVQDDVTEETILKFLTSQQNTLRTFKSWKPRSTGMNVGADALPDLRHLEHLSFVFFGSPITSLLSKAPNLISLELNNYSFNSKDLGFSSGYLCSSTTRSLAIHLTELTDRRDLAPFLHTMGHLFPNLETFDLTTNCLSNADMDSIFSSMVHLKNLTFRRTQTSTGVFYVTDDCFTGMSSFDGRPRRSFQDLKELQNLELSECNALTDGAILNGLSYCIKLTSVQLASKQFTDKVIVSIAEHLTQLRNLNIGLGSSSISPKTKFYLEQQLPQAVLDLEDTRITI